MSSYKTAEKKRNWLIKTFDLAYERGVSVNERKLINEFCFIHNSTERTAKEYIEQFVTSGMIIRVEEELIHPTVYREILAEMKDKKIKETQVTL